MIIDGDDIYGDGVNIAARLEGLAEAGGICISDSGHEQVQAKVETTFADMGTPRIKNIYAPIRIWRWPAGIEIERVVKVAPPLPDKPSIAVLPFENQSGDPEQEYFADGIAEDLNTDLSKVSGLFVVARNSTLAYKGKARDIRDIAGELGVGYLLEGSVRKAGERVRINAQLVEAQGMSRALLKS